MVKINIKKTLNTDSSEVILYFLIVQVKNIISMFPVVVSLLVPCVSCSQEHKTLFL